jgi:hypothetical protein
LLTRAAPIRASTVRSREKIKKLQLRNKLLGTGSAAKSPNLIYAESLAQEVPFWGTSL